MNFAGAARPLDPDGLDAAAAAVGVDSVLLWTVVAVETSGCGFLPDRRPAILFERHVFSRLTGKRFDQIAPAISGPAGGYGASGANQFARLETAIGYDRRAALESASWGIGQVMGYNAGAAGFTDVEDLVAQMMRGESEQLLGMAQFMRANGMHTALRQGDWAGFARRYNGPSYAKNHYDEKLASAHATFVASGVPDLRVRGVQLLLLYLGYDPGPIDGAAGNRTRRAIAAFTAATQLPAMLPTDKALYAALLDRLPA